MTLNNSTSDTYHQPVEQFQEEKTRSPLHLPRLVWVSLLLFAANLVILGGSWASPEIQVGMYGQDNHALSLSGKPSPFTERISTAPLAKPRPALKVTPVLYEQTADLTQLSIPRATAIAASQDLALPRMSSLSR